MFGIRALARALLAIAALGAMTPANTSENSSTLRSELERISQWRILIGHQSVGMNLIDGVKMIAMTQGVPVRIVETKSARDIQPATIGHAFIAANGNPLQKLDSFEHVMGPHRTEIDIAIVKFCYVDFKPDTDVRSLFNHYQSTIDGLRARNPDTTFVHVTAPLTTAQGGVKAGLKKMFGLAPYGILENMRREEYNALLRKAYHGEPIFDLARVESTTLSGTEVFVEWKDHVVPVMDSAYTDDGGHLNEVGRVRAARELIAVLASIRKQQATGRVQH